MEIGTGYNLHTAAPSVRPPDPWVLALVHTSLSITKLSWESLLLPSSWWGLLLFLVPLLHLKASTSIAFWSSCSKIRFLISLRLLAYASALQQSDQGLQFSALFQPRNDDAKLLCCGPLSLLPLLSSDSHSRPIPLSQITSPRVTSSLFLLIFWFSSRWKIPGGLGRQQHRSWLAQRCWPFWEQKLDMEGVCWRCTVITAVLLLIESTLEIVFSAQMTGSIIASTYPSFQWKTFREIEIDVRKLWTLKSIFLPIWRGIFLFLFSIISCAVRYINLQWQPAQLRLLHSEHWKWWSQHWNCLWCSLLDINIASLTPSR